MADNEVRVRYAPSPTGLQHIGGVRTALFNYLYAHSKGGKFILRLEDTDQTRYDEKYVKNLYDTMDWLGIDWDEGGSKGGEYGPYVQSERFELYKEYAMKLVEKGEAYYCFCDAERLDRIRLLQTKNKMPPGYDRNCRHLTAEEVQANLDAGKPYVIRLKVPLEGVTKFNDALENGHMTCSFGVEIDANNDALRNVGSLLLVMGAEDKEMFCDYNNQFHELTRIQVELIQKELIKT